MRMAMNLPAEVHWHARGVLAALDAVPRPVARVVRAAVRVGMLAGLGAVAALGSVAGVSAARHGLASMVASAPVAVAAASTVAEETDGEEAVDVAVVSPRGLGPGAPGVPIAAPVTPAGPPPGLRVARVMMPRLGVDHVVERVGVVAGQMQAPSDGVRAVGWYAEYAMPGYGGNAVFSAHETWNRVRAPFYSLHLAREGDEVSVALSDGRRLRYAVVSNTRYDAARIPMGEIIWPSSIGADEEWVTFITCGGRFVPTGGGLGEYLDRDVVVARRV